MKTPMFNRYIRVPKCCMSLPFKQKCLPCQNCVRAWDAYHEFNYNSPPYGERNEAKWESELDAFIDQEVKKQRSIADPFKF